MFLLLKSFPYLSCPFFVSLEKPVQGKLSCDLYVVLFISVIDF